MWPDHGALGSRRVHFLSTESNAKETQSLQVLQWLGCFFSWTGVSEKDSAYSFYSFPKFKELKSLTESWLAILANLVCSLATVWPAQASRKSLHKAGPSPHSASWFCKRLPLGQVEDTGEEQGTVGISPPWGSSWKPWEMIPVWPGVVHQGQKTERHREVTINLTCECTSTPFTAPTLLAKTEYVKDTGISKWGLFYSNMKMDEVSSPFLT